MGLKLSLGPYLPSVLWHCWLKQRHDEITKGPVFIWNTVYILWRSALTMTVAVTSWSTTPVTSVSHLPEEDVDQDNDVEYEVDHGVRTIWHTHKVTLHVTRSVLSVTLFKVIQALQRLCSGSRQRPTTDHAANARLVTVHSVWRRHSLPVHLLSTNSGEHADGSVTNFKILQRSTNKDFPKTISPATAVNVWYT